MKTLLLSLALGVLAPSGVFAGVVYGSIQFDGKSIEAGVTVDLMSAVNDSTVLQLDCTETDKYGSYRLYVKDPGTYILRVHYGTRVLGTDVYARKKRTQYNLVILHDKQTGRYSLGRQ